MTQSEIDLRVAMATGEQLSEIRRRGFQIADPLVVAHDPERSAPLVFDWDSMQAVELYEITVSEPIDLSESYRSN